MSRYMYDARHNTILHVKDDEMDVFDERGVLKDGKKIRVSTMMRDSSSPPPGTKMWHGESIPMHDSDVRRAAAHDDNVQLISRQEMADWDKAQLSARWKGGLQDGDRVRIGDKMMVVSGRNPTNGKIQLSDASTSAQNATALQDAYDSYDAEIQTRYLNTRDAVAGEACTTAGREPGKWREKDGRLVCVPGDKSSKENEIAGPLSDAARAKVMDQAYADYDTELANRWRR